MRGTTMRLFTADQHKEILAAHGTSQAAARAYSEIAGREISERTVRYWRQIFIKHDGNMAKADRELKAERKFIKPQPDDDFGTLCIPDEAKRILVIPDLHAPYHHPDALAFLKVLRDEIKPDLVVQLGDELDYHAMSFHDSDPNLDSAGTELEKGRVFLNELHDVFPSMLLCHSNHGSMVYRRAKAHGIPVQMLKRYRDVIFPDHGAPGWSWAFGWRVNTLLGEVMFKHQTSGIITDAAHNACNLVVGHSHGNFSVEYSASSAHLYYGVYAGCLVDKDSLAFAYGKNSLRKPVIGAVLILKGRPLLIPMVLDSDGRWIGELQ